MGTQASADEPGIVCYLSQLMSDSQISMLNFRCQTLTGSRNSLCAQSWQFRHCTTLTDVCSTYDCETFLVRELDLERAVALLEDQLQSGVHPAQRAS